jgi:hypothetical protein
MSGKREKWRAWVRPVVGWAPSSWRGMRSSLARLILQMAKTLSCMSLLISSTTKTTRKTVHPRWKHAISKCPGWKSCELNSRRCALPTKLESRPCSIPTERVIPPSFSLFQRRHSLSDLALFEPVIRNCTPSYNAIFTRIRSNFLLKPGQHADALRRNNPTSSLPLYCGCGTIRIYGFGAFQPCG